MIWELQKYDLIYLKVPNDMRTPKNMTEYTLK